MTKEQLSMPRCDIEELKEKLDMAVKALEEFYLNRFEMDGMDMAEKAKEVLAKIKGDK